MSPRTHSSQHSLAMSHYSCVVTRMGASAPRQTLATATAVLLSTAVAHMHSLLNMYRNQSSPSYSPATAHPSSHHHHHHHHQSSQSNTSYSPPGPSYSPSVKSVVVIQSSHSRPSYSLSVKSVVVIQLHVIQHTPPALYCSMSPPAISRCTSYSWSQPSQLSHMKNSVSSWEPGAEGAVKSSFTFCALPRVTRLMAIRVLAWGGGGRGACVSRYRTTGS